MKDDQTSILKGNVAYTHEAETEVDQRFVTSKESQSNTTKKSKPNC